MPYFLQNKSKSGFIYIGWMEGIAYSLKKTNEFLYRYARVFNNAFKRPAVNLSMVRDDEGDLFRGVKKFNVAAALPDFHKSCLDKSTDYLVAGKKRGLHIARLKTLWLEDGRISLGFGSKYRRIASLIFFIASALVLPWLWHPGKEGTLTAIYPSSSFSNTILSLILITSIIIYTIYREKSQARIAAQVLMAALALGALVLIIIAPYFLGIPAFIPFGAIALVGACISSGSAQADKWDRKFLPEALEAHQEILRIKERIVRIDYRTVRTLGGLHYSLAALFHDAFNDLLVIESAVRRLMEGRDEDMSGVREKAKYLVTDLAILEDMAKGAYRSAPVDIDPMSKEEEPSFAYQMAPAALSRKIFSLDEEGDRKLAVFKEEVGKFYAARDRLLTALAGLLRDASINPVRDISKAKGDAPQGDAPQGDASDDSRRDGFVLNNSRFLIAVGLVVFGVVTFLMGSIMGSELIPTPGMLLCLGALGAVVSVGGHRDNGGSESKSTIKIDGIISDVPSEAVISSEDGLGDVVHLGFINLTDDEAVRVGHILERIEFKRTWGEKMQASELADFQPKGKWINSVRAKGVLVLVKNARIKAFIYITLWEEGRLAQIEFICREEDGVRGRGSFLMIVALEELRSYGIKEAYLVVTHKKAENTLFYRNLLGKAKALGIILDFKEVQGDLGYSKIGFSMSFISQLLSHNMHVRKIVYGKHHVASTMSYYDLFRRIAAFKSGSIFGKNSRLKKISDFFQDKLVAMVFIGSACNAAGATVLKFASAHTHYLQIAYLVFFFGFIWSLIFIPILGSYKLLSSGPMGAYKEVLSLWKVLNPKHKRYIWMFVFSTLITSVIFYLALAQKDITPAIILVATQLSMVPILHMSVTHLGENKDWPRKLTGILVSVLSVFWMIFWEWKVNPGFIINLPLLSLVVLVNIIAGIPAVYIRKMFQEIYAKNSQGELLYKDESRKVLDFLPLLLTALRYGSIFVVLFIPLAVWQAWSGFSLFRFKGEFIFAHPFVLVAIITSTFFYVVHWLFHWKLYRMISYDLSKIRPGAACSPVISALLSGGLNISGFKQMPMPFVSGFSWLATLGVIFGSWISASSWGIRFSLKPFAFKKNTTVDNVDESRDNGGDSDSPEGLSRISRQIYSWYKTMQLKEHAEELHRLGTSHLEIKNLMKRLIRLRFLELLKDVKGGSITFLGAGITFCVFNITGTGLVIKIPFLGREYFGYLESCLRNLRVRLGDGLTGTVEYLDGINLNLSKLNQDARNIVLGRIGDDVLDLERNGFNPIIDKQGNIKIKWLLVQHFTRRLVNSDNFLYDPEYYKGVLYEVMQQEGIGGVKKIIDELFILLRAKAYPRKVYPREIKFSSFGYIGKELGIFDIDLGDAEPPFDSIFTSGILDILDSTGELSSYYRRKLASMPGIISPILVLAEDIDFSVKGVNTEEAQQQAIARLIQDRVVHSEYTIAKDLACRVNLGNDKSKALNQILKRFELSVEAGRCRYYIDIIAEALSLMPIKILLGMVGSGFKRINLSEDYGANELFSYKGGTLSIGSRTILNMEECDFLFGLFGCLGKVFIESQDEKKLNLLLDSFARIKLRGEFLLEESHQAGFDFIEARSLEDLKAYLARMFAYYVLNGDNFRQLVNGDIAYSYPYDSIRPNIRKIYDLFKYAFGWREFNSLELVGLKSVFLEAKNSASRFEYRDNGGEFVLSGNETQIMRLCNSLVGMGIKP